MRDAWHKFWRAFSALFGMVALTCEAGEIYAGNLKRQAELDLKALDSSND